MKQTLAMLCVMALMLVSLAGCGEKKDSGAANGGANSAATGTENGSVTSDGLTGDDMSGENERYRQLGKAPQLCGERQ